MNKQDVTKQNKFMEQIKFNKKIKLINLNQGMGLIKSSHDIQL